MPRIRITGLPKAAAGFIQTAAPPQLFTPPKILDNYQENDIEVPIDQDSLYNNSVKSQQEADYRKQFPNAPKELTGTTSKPFTPSGSEAVYEWSDKYAKDKGFANKANASIKKPTKQSLLSRTANTINTVLPIANLATDMVTNTIKQKEWDKMMRGEIFNTNPVSWAQNKGDWETNTGIFRPNQLSTPNIGMYAQDGMEVLSSDYSLQSPYIPDSPNPFINMPATISTSKPANVSTSYISEPNMGPVSNAVEALSSVQAKLESGYDPTKPPTAKENIKAWNVPASKTIYGKWQVSQDERKEAYKNLPELKNTFSTFQEYNDAFLGRVNPEIQQQVQELTYKKFLAPRNLQLAGGDIYAAALYHYLPAAAKLYTQGKLDLSLKPGELFPNNKTLVAADNINPTFGSYLDRFKKEYARQKKNNVFDIGGQNNNTMKIKIVGTPDDNQQMAGGGQPKYSGQSDYGLYIGQRNLYSSMPENIYKDAGNSVTEEEESAENPHVLEAEGGETILRPDGTHMNINGPSHAEGGVKLTKEQAPPKSFIFSQTGKMKIKNPEVLKHFGKTYKKGGITPAEIAKQYNVNKYIAILQDPHADKRSKDTALIMIENYERKLAELSLVQEGKKGFPQGIPDVAQKLLNKLQGEEGSAPTENSKLNIGNAKYGGGLEKYQVAGQYPSVPGGRTFNVNGKQIMAGLLTEAQKNKLKQISSYPGGFNLYHAPGAAGTSDIIKPGTPGQKRTWKPVPAGWSAEKLAAHNANKRKDPAYIGTPDVIISGQQEKPEEWAYTQETETIPTGKPNMTYTETKKENKDEEKDKLTVGDFTGVDNKIPYGWSNVDKRNLAATLFGAPKKYLPWSPQMEVETYRPTFDDWRAKAATRQAATNNAMNTMATYGPSQGLAANTAFMQGQQADQLIGDIAQTHSTNVGIANNAEAMNVQLRNAGREFKMKRAKELYDAGVIAKQQYDNAMRDYVQAGTQAWNQGDINAAYLYNQNISESPDYYTDPRTYKNVFNSKEAYNRFMNRNKGGYQAEDAAVQARAKQVAELMKQYGFDADDVLKIMGYPGSKTSTQKQTQTVQYPSNPAKNRITTYGSNTNTKKYGGSSSVFDGYNYKNPLLGK